MNNKFKEVLIRNNKFRYEESEPDSLLDNNYYNRLNT